MAHLPNMAALALSVPTGASTKRKTPLSAEEEAEKEAKKKQKLEEKKKEQAAVTQRIEQLLASGQQPKGDDPIGGWTPEAGPGAEHSCCMETGGRFGDHLPEELRGAEYVSVPTPKSRNVFSIKVVDAEGMERAKAEQRAQAFIERNKMSQEEWDERYGDKRRAQIDSLKARLEGYADYVNRVPKELRRFELSSTIHPRTPDARNRNYSKRDWENSVRSWARQVHEVWGPGTERQRKEREPRRVEPDAIESES